MRSMTRWPARFMVREPHRLAWVRNLVVLLAAWELAGRYELVASGALPAPSATVPPGALICPELDTLWPSRAT